MDRATRRLRGAGADAGHRPEPNSRHSPSLPHRNRRLFGAVRVFAHPSPASPRPPPPPSPLTASRPESARWRRPSGSAAARCIAGRSGLSPRCCAHIPDPPPVLFALGDLALLERPAVAIVGSRDHSDYGGEVAAGARLGRRVGGARGGERHGARARRGRAHRGARCRRRHHRRARQRPRRHLPYGQPRAVRAGGRATACCSPSFRPASGPPPAAFPGGTGSSAAWRGSRWWSKRRRDPAR